ncbi:MAG: hypothetical protein B6U72_07230 [Candidatus Altiarchaeales archaeon ex4484_2]|nr:MAG: hypothetical protein B6U72_07230 [Candidatus Altiarchaeales archaeon ex4484_2]
MKSVILAAGKGTRLKHYTEKMPKGMLRVNNKTIIEYQIEALHDSGIADVVIVTGYMAEKIRFPGVRYYINREYEDTNMVESLMSARKEFDDDLLVSYSDILYDKSVLDELIDYPGDFVVIVDVDWKRYWMLRYGRINHDTESLSLSDDRRITELGSQDPPADEIDARYVGLLKFSRQGLETVERIYDEMRESHWNLPWQKSGNVFRKAYMTDLLQEIIDRGYDVNAMLIRNRWIELDTVEDYDKARAWFNDGTLKDRLHLDLG